MKRRPDLKAAFRTRTFLGDTIAWIVFLALGTGGALYWYDWDHRRVLAADVDETGVEDPRIAVLAYNRLVERPDGRHVDTATLRSHIEALEKAGFQPVTLQGLRRFYRGEGTLPRRSVLLTFDHGYMSTRDAADPVLREKKWPAVMFLMTERQERRDPFFLYWPGLETMADSGIWEIGTHGDRGHEPIRIDADGTEGPFFLRRSWLAEPGRQETWEEYGERVRNDHLRARGLIEQRLHRQTVAYAPPLRDVAVTTWDPEVYRSYEDTVNALYDLAFIDDLFGLNDSGTDPHHLRRLRMAVGWSGPELLRRLQAGLGEAPATKDEGLARLWVGGTGTTLPTGAELVSVGPVRADLWRAGSQWSEDFSIEADVRIQAGQLWVVQQSANLSEEWRFGGDANRTHLQRRRPAEAVETLASFDTPIAPEQSHHLRLVRRGTGVWVEWDGRPVMERPAYLPERWKGNVGLVTWGGGETARLELRNLRYAPFPYRVHALEGRPSTEEVQAAIAEAPSVSALSPLWMELRREGLREHDVDRDLLSILARRYGWEIVPTLRVLPGGERALTLWLPQAMAQAKEAGWPGLRVDLGLLPPETQKTLNASVVGPRTPPAGLRVLVDGSTVWAPASTQLADASLFRKEARP